MSTPSSESSFMTSNKAARFHFLNVIELSAGLPLKYYFCYQKANLKGDFACSAVYTSVVSLGQVFACCICLYMS